MNIKYKKSAFVNYLVGCNCGNCTASLQNYLPKYVAVQNFWKCHFFALKRFTTISIFEPLWCLFNVTNGPFCLHLLGGKREREVARSGLVPQPQMASDGINNSNNKTGSNINKQNKFCGPICVLNKNTLGLIVTNYLKTIIQIILSDKQTKASGKWQKTVI